ncbi:MAG: BtrH N-terminal domain-containing protein [Sulfuricurvum sp.]|uniref:BtrH N-terminal domain-containing protein n=1 Tax=Sulfuricurvum sp. TaxID=2025608 RepID=UPI0026095F80|nr:BtrH N-terminal domain-containing protein [Sulfuricurvum sp.]MDD2829442.1 BtrH N-terminal domain-containing protein [Sulfuricurvum sp.]MDD4948475.1 BtrH N-terminal domain-containing protein [Sulfuricurvum sp.]
MGEFTHRHSAHCESGVVSSLITHGGYPISEVMAFGIGNGLTFAYLPIVKIDGMPLIAYRMPPRSIIKTITKRLGLVLRMKTYPNPTVARDDLSAMLREGKLVGLQTSVYYLPYFPPEMRFHFNAHNLLVYGQDENGFNVSDPVFEDPMHIGFNDLDKARFARGVFAPKGACYTIESIPHEIDLKKAITKAIKRTTGMMLYTPFPWVGIRGMKMMKKAILKLPNHPHKRYASLYLGHIIRMQEEIGTGGGGFRLMYAGFLFEAADILGRDELKIASTMMGESGDAWRRFALSASKACKGSEYSVEEIASKLQEAIDLEEKVYRYLRGLKL